MIQRVINAFAQIIADGRQATRPIVGVIEFNRVWQNHSCDLPNTIVFIPGGTTAINCNRQQPTAGVIDKIGDNAIGIDNSLRLPATIVVLQLNDMTQGIRNTGAVAIGIVGVDSDIIDLCTRAVFGENMAAAVVGITDQLPSHTTLRKGQQ